MDNQATQFPVSARLSCFYLLEGCSFSLPAALMPQDKEFVSYPPGLLEVEVEEPLNVPYSSSLKKTFELKCIYVFKLLSHHYLNHQNK